MAKVAERALLSELADDSGTKYISYGYWDSLKSGLFALASLQHNIKRLEVTHLEQNSRKYELTMVVTFDKHPTHVVP
jgi:hypothetical protein